MEKLTRYATENKTLFYRSRFTIAPKSKEVGEIWPHIVAAIQEWLEEKEGDREDKELPNFYTELTDDAANISESVAGAKGSAYASRRLANGTLECNEEDSSVKANALYQNGSDTPSYWAIEYIENDKDHWYRRWFTNIGATAAGNGSYIINVRIAIADDPTFICDRPYIPSRNTPRFIGKLLDIKGCVASSNGIALANEPQALTSSNMKAFIRDLESNDRTIPFVVIAALRNKSGQYAIDPGILAKKVRGSAVVYTLDCSAVKTWIAYRSMFLDSETALDYRINPGFMRIFFPGVDRSDPAGSQRHRFYTGEMLMASNPGHISNDVCGAFTRLYRRVQGEAIDPTSITLIESQLKRKQLEQKLQELRSARAQEEQVEPDYQGLHTEEELKRALEQLKAHEAAKLAETTEFYESLIAEYDAEAKRLDQGDDVLELQIAIEELNTEIEQLQRATGAKDHTIQTLNQLNEKAKAQARQAETQANIIRAMQGFPKTCAEALGLAERAFGDRLIITNEAKDSAAKANRSISNDETFDILRTLAVNLWPKYFEQDEADGTAGTEFQSETGYDLTFHESAQTNKDPRLLKQREISYDGRTLNIAPHVKGKSGNRNAPLRIHFAIDRPTRKIIIGHCGDHMETAGTRKVAR
ncbi:hypothetical protein [Senegalimassilia anaerobia]|uniref:hypothetical protein n=1 Tax=Senegalimassilia anaerobia TaxID=1473216 RepID=UPI003A970E6C